MRYLSLFFLFVSLPFVTSSQIVPTNIAADGIELYVGMQFSYAWETGTAPSDAAGIYRLPIGGSQAESVYSPVMVGGGVAYHDGKVYVNSFDASNGREWELVPQWRIYDLATGELEAAIDGQDNLEDFTNALTYDISEDIIYAVLQNNNGIFLASIVPATGEKTIIGRLTDIATNNSVYTCRAIAASRTGRLYIMYEAHADPGTMRLARVNKTTAYFSQIGDGVSCDGMLEGDYLMMMNNRHAIFFNHQTDKMYWIHTGSSLNVGDYYTPMFEVNLSTARATMVGYLADGYTVTGAFFAEPELASPAGVENLKYEYSATSDDRCTGHLSFTAPSVSYDGKELSGELTIVINEGDNEVARIDGVTPGATLATDEQVYNYGEHTYTAYAISADGEEGVSRTFTVFVGYDLPANPTNLTHTIDNHTLTLSWNAPTTGIHGAEIDADAITYRIYRYYAANDVQIVADNLSATTYSQEIPSDLTRYLFIVYACYKGNNGYGVSSGTFIAGDPLDVPYSTNFDDLDVFVNTYKIVDANEDGYYWTWYYDGAVYPYSEVNAADDWLFTPPINYEAGRTYELAINVASSLSGYLESMEVGFGGNEVDQQKVLLTISEVPLAPTNYSVEVTPEESGVYYFGFHATSPAFCEYLWLYSVNIEDVTPSSVANVADKSSATIFAADGNITVVNPAGDAISIYTVNGALVAKSGDREFVATVPAGVYVVKCGGTVKKVIVK